MGGKRVPVGPAIKGPAPRTPLVARPAVWMLSVLLLMGAWRIGSILSQAFAGYPIATAVAVVLFAAYAVPFVVLVRMIDYLDREPPPLQVIAFAWGALVATSAAIAGSGALQNILAKRGSPRLAAEWGPALAGAGTEEILKVLGVVAIALVARSRVTGIVSGFVYGALVGLGFQVVEDVVFAVNAVAVDAGTDRVGPVILTFLVRGFLGGLWSHTLFTALAGAGVAYALVRRDRGIAVRSGVAVALLGAAWGFHFLWNSPLLTAGVRYGFVGLLAVLMVKGIPALLVGVALIAAAERREADYFAAVLAGLADPRIATPDEIAALVSPRRRVAERRHAKARLGWAGARAVRRLQRAQARLAVAVSRDPGLTSDANGAAIAPPQESATARRRREVLRRRHELLALGLGRRRGRTGRGVIVTVLTVAVQVLVVGLLVLGVGLAIRALGGG